MAQPSFEDFQQTLTWQKHPERRAALKAMWDESDDVTQQAMMQYASGNFPVPAAPAEAPVAPDPRTVKARELLPRPLRAVSDVGENVAGGMMDVARGIPQIPGALAAIPGKVMRAGQAIYQNPQEAIPRYATKAAHEAIGMIPFSKTLTGAARTIASGDPRFLAPATTTGRETGQYAASMLLGKAIPTVAKRTARAIVRETPGAAVELHSLAIPKVRDIPETVRPTAGAAKTAYARLANFGNPKLFMGRLRSRAARMLLAEEKLANPDTGLIHELQNFLTSSREGWTFDQAKAEAERLGAELGQVSTNRGATASGSPQGLGRIRDKELRRLFSAIHQDVEAGRPLVVKRPAVPPQPLLGPGGAPMLTRGARQPMMRKGSPAVVGAGQTTTANVAQSEAWKTAARLARRDFAATGLARMIEDGITVAGDQFQSLNVNPVIKKIQRAQRLALQGDKRAKLFVGSFNAGELNKITKTLKEIGHRLPRIPPAHGAITGSSQRALHIATGAGVGAIVGEFTGGPGQAAVGAMAGTWIPHLVAQAMMTDVGRAVVRRAMKIDPTIGPVFQNTVAAFLRSEAQQPQGGQ